MAKVFIQVNGSSATYEIQHEIDGIYTAVLISKIYSQFVQFSEKIILIRTRDSWRSDCPSKIVALKIGKQINEYERSS